MPIFRSDEEESRPYVFCEDCGANFMFDQYELDTYGWDAGAADDLDHPIRYEAPERYLEHLYFCDYCNDSGCPAIMHDLPETTICQAASCRRAYDRDYGGDGGDNRLHGYSYKPSSWQPRGEYPAQALLGWELELDGDVTQIIDAALTSTSNIMGQYIFAKEDGSVPDGCELVSHPATLDWITDNFDYSGMFESLEYVDEIGTTSETGLHVHVSRNAFHRGRQFSISHRFAWLSFIYASAVQCSQIGRRNPNGWARITCNHHRRTRNVSQWWQIERDCADCYSLRGKAESDRWLGSRYVAVNACNSRTYELRFPRSTTNASTFAGTLQFVDATVEYTRGLGTSQLRNGLRWSAFMNWAGDRSGRYQDFLNLWQEVRFDDHGIKPVTVGTEN